MKYSLASSIFLLLALTGCSGAVAPSQNDLESLVSQARVEAAAGQNKEAEKKLLECLEHSDKTPLSYARLAALNELVEVETKLQNESKAKVFLKQAGLTAETIAGQTVDSRTAEAARNAIFRYADRYAEEGYYDSASTLYRKALVLEQRSQLPTEGELSAAIRLQKLAEKVRMEKHAIERESGKFSNSDPRAIARAGRLAERKELLNSFKELQLSVTAHPSKEKAQKMLLLLEKFRTIYGIREGEYRNAFGLAMDAAFANGQREKAVQLLTEDLAKFENVSPQDVERENPTALESANFAIADLGQLALLYSQIDDYERGAQYANRGLALAERVKSPDTIRYADCLKIAADWTERCGKRQEAIPLRRREIQMLQNLKFTDEYQPYVVARLELGRSLGEFGQKEEALKLVNYATERLEKMAPHSDVLAHAYVVKSELLQTLGDIKGAYQSHSKAKPIWDSNENDKHRYLRYSALCTLAITAGRFDDALTVTKQMYGFARALPKAKQNAALAETYERFGEIYSHDGDKKKAVENLNRALEYRVKADGENNIIVVGILNQLAALKLELNQPADAEKHHLRAISIAKQLKNSDPLPTASTIIQLANFYHRVHQPKKAIPLYQEAIAILDKSTRADAREYNRTTKIQMAQLLLVLGDRKQAENLKTRMLAETLSNSNERPSEKAHLYLIVGDLCENLNDFDNAEKLYLKAKKLTADYLPELQREKTESLQRLINLYKVTKRPKLAQSVETELNRSQKPANRR